MTAGGGRLCPAPARSARSVRPALLGLYSPEAWRLSGAPGDCGRLSKGLGESWTLFEVSLGASIEFGWRWWLAIDLLSCYRFSEWRLIPCFRLSLALSVLAGRALLLSDATVSDLTGRLGHTSTDFHRLRATSSHFQRLPATPLGSARLSPGQNKLRTRRRATRVRLAASPRLRSWELRSLEQIDNKSARSAQILEPFTFFLFLAFLAASAT